MSFAWVVISCVSYEFPLCLGVVYRSTQLRVTCGWYSCNCHNIVGLEHLFTENTHLTTTYFLLDCILYRHEFVLCRILNETTDQ